MIKYNKKEKCIDFTNNLYITFYNDWKQLFNKFNWYTFSLIKLEYEIESYLGGMSLDLALLGFGFYIKWNYEPEKLDKMIKKAEKGMEKMGFK